MRGRPKSRVSPPRLTGHRAEKRARVVEAATPSNTPQTGPSHQSIPAAQCAYVPPKAAAGKIRPAARDHPRPSRIWTRANTAAVIERERNHPALSAPARALGQATTTTGITEIGQPHRQGHRRRPVVFACSSGRHRVRAGPDGGQDLRRVHPTRGCNR